MSTTTFHKILRPLLLSIFILGCFVTAFFMYFKPSTSWLNIPIPSAFSTDRKDLPTKSNESMTTVLVWFWPFGQVHDLDHICSSLYNIDGCYITADRTFYDKSDGVFIHHRDISGDLSNLPKLQRPPLQRWIWVDFESPTHSPKLPGIENLFNLTLNYRRDADIHVPYGYLIPRETKEDFVPPKKDKLVCWIVSNWRLHYFRVKYFHELQAYIHVDTFGNAFGKHISDQDFNPIMASCKFYLAFENSIHKDYITEKLYNPLTVGTVPVVLGASRKDYEQFVQGDAFIHVDDFSSPKELAEYLKLLDQNEEKYLQYFNWQRNFEVKSVQFWTELSCLACDYLKKHKEYKSFKNLHEWYWD